MQLEAVPMNDVQVQKQDVFFETTYKVYKTKDYSIFCALHGNRTYNLLHVKRLMQSFTNKHLISPIIVNENFQVIDGQHRLQASKEMDLPVYFIIIEGYGITDVQIYNINQKNWVKKDYLKMYCDQGIKEYLQFKKFMTDFPDFEIQASERILTQYKGNGGRQTTIDKTRVKARDFEEGKLQIPDLNKSYIAARKIMDFKKYYPGFNRGTFVSTMLDIMENKNYKHSEMMKKLELNPKWLQNCPDVAQYKVLIEDIYNFKRAATNKVSLRYNKTK